MEQCTRCKCKLSIDNFDKNNDGSMSTRCKSCKKQNREYRQQTYQRKPSIAITHPNLLDEWDDEKNTDVDPYEITSGSAKKIWWICSKDNHHKWRSNLNTRTRGTIVGCPICVNLLICPEDQCNSIGKIKNDVGSLKYADILREWGESEESKYTFAPLSSKKVQWICSKNNHHKWTATISSRTGKRSTGCPICLNRLICPIDQCNSIGKVKNENGSLKYADLLEEWGGNEESKYNFAPSSGGKVLWICRIVRHHEWHVRIADRTRYSTGCPICYNRLICPKDQCNSIGKIKNAEGFLKYADLLEEWGESEDSKYNYFPSSNKKVLWICKKINHHKWVALICSRTAKNASGCPICSNNLICPKDQCNSIGKIKNNDGSLRYTDILKEWGGNENSKYNYTPSSNIKVLWICRKFQHKWYTSVGKRTGKDARGCPICRESKGEKAVAKTLETLSVVFKPQKQQLMKVTKYNRSRRLVIDFFGTINDMDFAIEYDGEAHFDPDNYYSKKNNYADSMTRDWLKTQWCTENGIKLLRIHYGDFNYIQENVQDFIANIDTADILTLSSNPNGDYDFMIGDCPPINIAK